MQSVSIMPEGPAGSTPAPRRGKDAPERTCLVTRATGDRRNMIRFVISPDGEAVPDIDSKLPGRGFWLTARRDIVRTASARNAFAKAARRPVAVSPDLDDRVDSLLARKCLDTLGFARRAGEAVAGFEKVRAAIADGRCAVLLVAADAAPGGRDRFDKAARDVSIIRLFSAEEIGAIFGRDRTVYAAVAPGALAEHIRERCARLAGFRDLPQVGKLS